MAMHDRQTVQLFYNPTAGRHCEKKLAQLRSGFEAGRARVILSECGPGTDIRISDEASHVCALGGDGTIRHVALALLRCGRPLPLSVYPAGTVNLLHREIGSPLHPSEHAARALDEGARRPHFSVEINDTLFLACASVGPDARAVAALSPRLKRRVGKAAYAAAFCGVLLNWRRDELRLSHEGGETLCEAFYVAKGRFFAGPWSFAPEAGLGQPLLHVIALRTARRRDFARFAWAVFRGGGLERLPGVHAFTCTELEAEGSTAAPVQADGDIIARLPVRIRLRPDPMAFC